ncbi:uncharacterized protein Dmoj_GI26725 [Drosophila mojavensis]|uniref:BPTI/Kunitz inhibitor domain-containing protein n=1 Tax=Drosophila mojavensis TaxID=7230 RepID=A0A0Q9XH37_DROMO|nr:uncharacterized protein Dmoj_GI26725 [Drosophila mojavensis]
MVEHVLDGKLTRSCKKMSYKGCGGNRNRYNDRSSCLMNCT